MHDLDLSIMRKHLRTKDDASELQLILEQLNNDLFKKEASAEQLLKEGSSYEKGLLLQELAKDANIAINDKDQLQAFCSHVKSLIAALPMVNITLAIEPKDAFIASIHEWFYHNYKVVVLLDIQTDPRLIGGSVIRFNGQYKDYSLRKRLEAMEEEGLN